MARLELSTLSRCSGWTATECTFLFTNTQAVCASNILRNWALQPGGEAALAAPRCVDAVARALATASHDDGAAGGELTGNLLDVLQQVIGRSAEFCEHGGVEILAFPAELHPNTKEKGGATRIGKVVQGMRNCKRLQLPGEHRGLLCNIWLQ